MTRGCAISVITHAHKIDDCYSIYGYVQVYPGTCQLSDYLGNLQCWRGSGYSAMRLILLWSGILESVRSQEGCSVVDVIHQYIQGPMLSGGFRFIV